MSLSAPHTRRSGEGGLLAFFASRYWMALFFPLTAGCALAVAYKLLPATQVMILPLGLLAVSLVAAIATRPALRTDGALLLLHLALLALLVLFAYARLTYLDAAVSLNVGMPFEGQLQRRESGPWHTDRLDELRFVNEGFTENFPQRGQYMATYNKLRWRDVDGTIHAAVIGDDHPLIVAGYRIYTSHVRGFTPVFHWVAATGEEELGSVQLNDTRLGHFAQANAWQLAGGPRLWAMIELLDPEEASPGTRRANLNTDMLKHKLIVRIEEQRHELALGDTLDFPQGRLTYVRLDSWMGYRIVHDPTQPWLLATLALAVGSLVWFYLRRLTRRIPQEHADG